MKPLLFTLLTFFSLSVQAQVTSTFPDLPFTTFYDFDIKGDHIAALGTCDMLWYSTDGGVTWTYDKLVSISNYSIRFMPGADDRVIVSQFRGMAIYDFEDGVIEDFSDESDIVDNVNRAIAISGDDVYTFNTTGMYKLSTADMTWENMWQDTAANDVVHSVSVTDNFLYLGMRYGRLLRYNIATQVVEHRADLGDWITSLDMYSDDGGYLISNSNQKLLKTVDGGATFVELPNMVERINPVAYGENILLTINTNRIYVSEDGGESAELVVTANTPTFGNIGAAKFTDDGTLYMAGHAATLVKSTDYGRNFTVVNPVLRSDFNAITMDAEGVGLVLGEQGAALRTTDYGFTWTAVSLPFLEDEYVDGLVQIGTDEYLIVSEQLYRVKGGVLEETLDINVNRLLVDKDGAYLLATVYDSGESTLQKSVDKGATWEVLLSGLESSFALSQDTEGNIWTISSGNNLAKSTDGGATWTEQPLAFEPWQIAFYDGNTGMLSAGNALYQTTDGGATFDEIYNLYGLGNMAYVSEDHLIFTSATQSETTLFESTDGGENIDVIFNNCTITNDLVVNTKGDAVLAQRSGHINVVPLAGSITSTIDEDETDRQATLIPNPVAVGGQFHTDLEWESLQLYTSQGQLVRSHSTYQPSVSTVDLEPGLYVVSMTTGTDRYTAKLVVL